MEPIKRITSKTVVIPLETIDTDQITPARFLKVTSKVGLGKVLFADWRYDAAGKEKPEFVLNKAEAQGAQVLVAGDNFGCGSSREHAPWALVDHGFRAVVSTTIADIFRNNSLKNGLLPVVVSQPFHAKLLAAPGATVSVDLESQTITGPDGASETFPVDPFARYCLLNGIDELGFLLQQEPAVAAYEARAASAKALQ
jgi:3-isopropylmalate/(R)-2-methylmalate dehydratase small subunit